MCSFSRDTRDSMHFGREDYDLFANLWLFHIVAIYKKHFRLVHKTCQSASSVTDGMKLEGRY